MSEIINAFNNSWPFVQIVMLLTLVALIALPVWLVQRWLSLRHKLPDNVLLALSQDGDTLTLTLRKGAPVSKQQIAELLPDHSTSHTP